MNRQALCLRCDWQGETRAHMCPNCGVRLYRRVDPASRAVSLIPRIRARLPRSGEPPTSAAPVLSRAPLARRIRPGEETSGEVRSPAKRGVAAAFVAFAVIAAGVSVWFIQQHTPAPVRQRTGEVGTIIYTARSADGQTRLYRWDLVADAVSRGPVVHDLIGLFDASAAHPGWVGETSGSPAGGVDIGVFKFLGPDDQALPLGHGDAAAWAPQGGQAVVETARPAANGCSNLLVLSVHLSPPTQDPIRERVCASVEGVQLSQEKTYLSLLGPKGSRVASVSIGRLFVSIGRLRTILDHYRLDSLSPANDMVVTPDTPSPSAPGCVTDAIETIDHNAALFFRGPAGQCPTPYRSAGAPFVLDRVLAWAPDGSEALALGSAGGRTGFFRLEAAPPSGPRQPATWVGPVDDGYADGLFTGVTRLVFTGGQFSRVLDGSMTPFPLPPGAPAPAGPMIWIGA